MTKTFEELYRLDVTEHIEKKANLSYLSWAWAHAEMKKADPDAKITVHEFPEYIAVGDTVQTVYKPFLRDGGGAWVKVSVTLNNRTETEYLPVMDMRNKAVINPDATTVNKNIKRCFVKALALHGLGLYVYLGEDAPEQEPPKPATATQKAGLKAQIEELAPHLGVTFAQAENKVFTKQKVKAAMKDITNEEYGLLIGYVKELLDFYAKNPDKSKKQEPAADTEAEQVGMELQYNIPEK